MPKRKNSRARRSKNGRISSKGKKYSVTSKGDAIGWNGNSIESTLGINGGKRRFCG